MKKIKILNVPFDVCTKDEALARVLDVLMKRGHEGGKHIVTPNPEMLLEAQKNPAFLETLQRAWLSIPDGIGILWASTFQEISRGNSQFIKILKAFFTLAALACYPKFCTKVFPERVTGTDLMESICAVSRTLQPPFDKLRVTKGGIPIFLLGAKPGIAEKVKEILEIRYRGVNIVGTFSGSPLEDDFITIQALIAETQPQILFVAYGSPSQELWITEHLKKLKSVKIAMGVGGAFDFIAGERKRAPKWMQKTGLEWLYRIIQEPSRWKRIWNATVKFPIYFLFFSLRSKADSIKGRT